VSVDAVQIRQCLLNLVLNALDAMREGHSEQQELTVATRLQSDKEIEIAVSDTGKGFVADTSDRVFEPFFATRDEGLGIGLSLTRSIVHSHGGRIWATPNTEHGVTFRFTLPIGDKE
jgi:two-component system sensor kinase FixL